MVIASIVLSALTIVAPGADPTGGLLFGAATLSFGLVGLLLIVRAPDNRIGPVLVLAGALLAFAYGCDVYGHAGAAADPAWPGSAYVQMIGDALFVVPIVLALIGIPLIFPNGHLISRRWRLVVWLAVMALTANTVASLIGPSTASSGVQNPFVVPSMEPLAAFLGGLASASSVIGFGAAAAALWVRYRRGDATERQQLKWLVAVAVLAAVFFPIAFIVPVQEIANAAFYLGSLTLVAMPLAIAVAIMRYRLYDIDRIISRTIAYGIITALLVAVFLVANLALQAALSSVTSSNALAVAGSTLLAAALFTPVRVRVQHVVDRRFDRARYDADRLTSEFGDRLRDEVDLATLGDELDATVRRAFAPERVGLWLRGGGQQGPS